VNTVARPGWEIAASAWALALQEPGGHGIADGPVGLDGDLAVERPIAGHEHLAQAIQAALAEQAADLVGVAQHLARRKQRARVVAL
jgi:hypothetical protein